MVSGSEGLYSVLIVDDQPGVRRLLYEALKDDFAKVYLADSGLEAIQQVREHAPDLVVMDMKMPGMNGLEALKMLRKMNFTNPVLLMTAYGELEVISQAVKLGVKKYISKPFDLKDMRNLIRDTLTEHFAQKVDSIS